MNSYWNKLINYNFTNLNACTETDHKSTPSKLPFSVINSKFNEIKVGCMLCSRMCAPDQGMLVLCQGEGGGAEGDRFVASVRRQRGSSGSGSIVTSSRTGALASIVLSTQDTHPSSFFSPVDQTFSLNQQSSQSSEPAVHDVGDG